MNKEMKPLDKNGTLEIGERLRDKKLVGYKWIYTIKNKSYNTINHYNVTQVA